MPGIFPIAGEHRKSVKTIVMQSKIMVSVEWPDGIEYSDEHCKKIAASAGRSSFEINVGPVEKIVWAKCYTESREVTIEEILE